MATTLTSLVTRVRDLINEPVASYWSDAELLRYMNGGINDLYRRIKDNLQDDFFTEDATNVSAPANTRALSGVPMNVAHVRAIRPRSLATYPNVRFWPRKYGDYDFQAAEACEAISPASGGDVLYCIVGTGGPVYTPGTPDVTGMSIIIAPKFSSALLLTLAYTPSRTEITSGATVNPIPGESDMALVYWTVAHALARTPHGDQLSMVPHPGYLKMYEDQLMKIGVATTPRQDDEPDVAEAFFELNWP